MQLDGDQKKCRRYIRDLPLEAPNRSIYCRYQLIFIIITWCYYCILDILWWELSPFCAWGRVSTWDCLLVSTSRDSMYRVGIILSNLGLPINKIAKVSYLKSLSIKWSIMTLFFLYTRAAQTVYKNLFFRAEELQSQGDRCICLA